MDTNGQAADAPPGGAPDRRRRRWLAAAWVTGLLLLGVAAFAYDLLGSWALWSRDYRTSRALAFVVWFNAPWLAAGGALWALTPPPRLRRRRVGFLGIGVVAVLALLLTVTGIGPVAGLLTRLG